MDTTRSRPRTRLAPDVRRDSILAAATEVFVDRGLAGATMADVAEAAGVAKGTVYLYFDSKDALVTALQERYAEELIAQAGDLLSTGGRGSRARRIDAFIKGIAPAYQQKHALFHVLFQAPGASELPIVDAFRSLLERFVLDGVEAGEFSVPDVAVTAEFLLQGLHGTISHTLHDPDGGRKAIPALQELARRTLGT